MQYKVDIGMKPIDNPHLLKVEAECRFLFMIDRSVGDADNTRVRFLTRINFLLKEKALYNVNIYIYNYENSKLLDSI